MSYSRNLRSFVPPVFGRAQHDDIRFVGNVTNDVVTHIESVVGYQHHEDLRLGKYVVSSFVVPEKADIGAWLYSIFTDYPGGLARFRSYSALFDHMAPQVFDDHLAILLDPKKPFTRIGIAELCAAVARYLGGVDSIPGSIEHELSLEALEERWCAFEVTPEIPPLKTGITYTGNKDSN